MKNLLEDAPTGTPDWMVTYGDLMSLLLTFFIMLVSMSELKHDDKYQGIADSLQAKFGANAPSRDFVPGQGRPRNASLAALATNGRALRKTILGAASQDTTANSASAQTTPMPTAEASRPTTESAIVPAALFSEPRAADRRATFNEQTTPYQTR